MSPGQSPQKGSCQSLQTGGCHQFQHQLPWLQTPRGREVPYAPKQAVRVLPPAGGRFSPCPATNPANGNTAAQPMRSSRQPISYFPPMNFHGSSRRPPCPALLPLKAFRPVQPGVSLSADWVRGGLTHGPLNKDPSPIHFTFVCWQVFPTSPGWLPVAPPPPGLCDRPPTPTGQTRTSGSGPGQASRCSGQEAPRSVRLSRQNERPGGK